VLQFLKTKKNDDYLKQFNLSERQMLAISFLKKNNKISNKEYQVITQISRETASRDLADLVEKGLIKSSGSKGAGSFYTLT
jgi:ATP-dependent DNA helicase RecG